MKSKSTSILTHIGAAAVGYIVGKNKKQPTQVQVLDPYNNLIVGEVDAATLKLKYPYYQISGTTKKQLSGIEYEKIIDAKFMQPVLAVNKTFLDKYQTI